MNYQDMAAERSRKSWSLGMAEAKRLWKIRQSEKQCDVCRKPATHHAYVIGHNLYSCDDCIESDEWDGCEDWEQIT